MYKNNLLNKTIFSSILLFPLVNVIFVLCNGNVLELLELNFVVKKLTICLGVAIAEELFFRGLVLRELVFGYNWRYVRASVVVSLIFGVLHLLNVNSYATWSYAIVQSICAFAVSFNLCAIFIKTKSLLWCVIIHALINITSIGLEYCANGQQLPLSNFDSVLFLSVSFIYLISGIKMLNDKMVEGK